MSRRSSTVLEWMERHGLTQEAFERCPRWVQVCVWVVAFEISALIVVPILCARHLW